MTRCLSVSISFSFCCAGLPHNMKTTFSRSSDTCLMMPSVNGCQPSFLWECASPASTVSTVLSNRTTSLAQSFRRSEEHTSELQSRGHVVCRLLLEKKNNKNRHNQERSSITVAQ